MPEIKRIAETYEVCYYDGNNGSYIVNTFFGGGGYSLVSDVDGVLTVYNENTSSNQVINAGTYALRRYYGDTGWRGAMTQDDLDNFYTVVGTSPR
ncbi:hypothetical protein SEA_DRYAD_29 [Streptomyces phage Dryad]|nr:hypothetical protein SEA_DRYAD_29 [Streptomyces phage Dryad]